MYQTLLIFSCASAVIFSPKSLCPELSGLCDCELKIGKIKINCQKLDGMNALMNTLHKSFLNRTIKEINILSSKLPALESKMFQGIDLIRLHIKRAFIGNISESALSGANNLNSVSFVQIINMEDIPKTLSSVDLVVLDIINCRLTSIGQQLQNKTSLKKLDLTQNEITTIHPDAFKNCVSLSVISMVNNNIKNIDPQVFRNCPELVSINFNENQLLSFDGVTYPITSSIQQLLLSNNSISTIDKLFLNIARHLAYLYLDNNPLLKLSAEDFSDRYRKLQVLSLNNTLLSSIENGTFDGLIQLKKLGLGQNKLTELPDDIFKYLIVLNTLNLDQNMISRIDNFLKWSTNLQKLDLSSNKIQNLHGAFSGLTILKKLNLEHNYIETIPNGTFSRMTKMELLILRRNKIKHLEQGSFLGLGQTLNRLELSFNKIEDLGGAFNVQPSMYKLQHLKLDNNLLTSISDSDLNLPGLILLELQSNKLEFLNSAFSRLFKLLTLNLLSNKLITITKENFPGNMHLKRLTIAGNPLSCDCRILWLAKALQSTLPIQVDSESICYAPEWMRNILVHKLTIPNVTIWKERCPEKCQPCQCKPNGTEITVSVSCSNRNLTSLPESYPNNTVELDCSQNRLTKLPENLAQIVPDLRYLNITGNQLGALIQKPFPPELTILDVSRNNMTRFPSQEVGKINLKICKLSGNPWICDCDAKSFLNWIVKNSRMILDVNETRCSGSSSSLHGSIVARLTELDLCPEEIALYAIISMAILAVLLGMSGTAIGYIRYQMPIKVWLYTRGLCLRWVKEEDLDEDKIFDAFVAFSSEDQQCVDQLLEQLEEREPHYRLCVHYRDFAAGELILENISWAVASSKKTLVLLSKDFLKSEWTMQEFREAYTLGLTEKMNRIILVLVGVTPPTEDLPTEVKAHVQSSTYLKWEDRFFWEKLLYAMPRNAIGKETRNQDRNLCNDREDVRLV